MTSLTVTSSPAAGDRLLRARLFAFGFGLMVGLFVVFFGWRAQSMVPQTEDIYRFAELGGNIAKGMGFAYEPGQPTMRRAPMYPGLIAFLYLFSPDNHLIVKLAQAVFAGGICLLAFEMGRILFTKRTGLIAAVLCGLHPMVLRYVPDIQVENLLTFLFTLTVWACVRFYFRPTLLNGFLIGVLGAMAAMVKGVVLPFPPLFALVWLWQSRRLTSDAAPASRKDRNTQSDKVAGPAPAGRKALLCAAMILVGMAVIILPWTLRNKRVFGKTVLISSNAGGEFLRGYVFAQPKYYLLKLRPYVEGELEANQMEIDLFKSQGKVWEQNEVETEEVLNRAAKEKLLHEPGALVKKSIIGTFMFWYVVTTRTNSLLILLLAAAGWLLALRGWRHRDRQARPFWLLFLPILVINATYAAVLALGRYSAPVIPTLMVLAAWGLNTLFPSKDEAPAALTLVESP